MNDLNRMIEEIDAAIEDGAVDLSEADSDKFEAIKLQVRVGQELSEQDQAFVLALWRQANQ